MVEEMLRMATVLGLGCDQVSVRRCYCDSSEHQWIAAVECSHPQQGRYVSATAPDERTAMKNLFADLVNRIEAKATEHEKKAAELRVALPSSAAGGDDA